MEFKSDSLIIFFPGSIIFVLSFTLAFLITYFGIPSIVRISCLKKLYDIPDQRKTHGRPVPTLGGCAIFSGVILSSVLFSSIASSHELKYIIAGMIIIFFIGLKDDILPLRPYKKILGQLAATFFIVVPGDIRITTFHNIFGIDGIGYLASIVITMLFFMALINSFNLIDGIDGLASGIGILVSAVFGLWFILAKHTSYAVFSLSLVGSLIAFFRFNVFSTRNKLFLGDTGSMMIGLLLAVFSVRFIEYENLATGILKVGAAPALVFAVLVIPLFDTGRVFITRVINRRSPFAADRNHIHHRLLSLLGSHVKVTFLLLTVNVLFISAAIIFRNQSGEVIIIGVLLIASILSYMPVISIHKKEKRNLPLSLVTHWPD